MKFTIKDNFAYRKVKSNKDVYMVVYIDDAKKNISRDWNIDFDMHAIQILRNDKLNIDIIEGYIFNKDMPAFEAFAKKLDEANSIIMNGYDEKKNYFKVCVGLVNKKKGENNDNK